jgi:hypothetical protein
MGIQLLLQLRIHKQEQQRRQPAPSLSNVQSVINNQSVFVEKPWSNLPGRDPGQEYTCPIDMQRHCLHVRSLVGRGRH